MPVAKLECPECGAVLTPSKPVPGGKKITCPKCDTLFLAPDDDEPDERVTARKPTSKKSNAMVIADDVDEVDEVEELDDAPAKKKKAKPAPAKKAKEEPKKEEPALETYGMAKDPDDEVDEKGRKKKKIKIDYAPDLTVKDPRGPATLLLAMPSNIMIAVSAINILTTVLAIAIHWWPALFTKYGTVDYTPGEVRKEYERSHPKPGTVATPKKADDDDKPTPEVELKDLKDEERAIMDEGIQFEWIVRLIVTGIGVTSLIFWGCVGFGAVKMQNLESYNWSMAAAIMSIIGAGYSVVSGLLWCICTIWIPAACLIAGIIAIINLRKPQVIAAFEYDPEKDH